MDERYTYHDLQMERWEIARREKEAVKMNDFTKTRIHKGELVSVQVLGLPESPKTDNVFTYRLHADAAVGDEVRVPAPDWSVRVTGHDTLVGYVLGPAGYGAWVDIPGELRDTMPLREPGSHAEGFAASQVQETVAAWRKQAAALTEAARGIEAAATALERAMG